MKKFLITFLFIVVGAYLVYTIVNQQQALNQYSKNKEVLREQIQEQNEYKEQLTAKKDNIDSLEYIEQIAREYLDMYLPNEKVYIDQGM